MARILPSINSTISGSCHHTDVVPEAELHGYALKLFKSASGALFGRNMFEVLELFDSFWPEVSDRSDLPQQLMDFARELQAKPKFAASSRNVVTSWPIDSRTGGVADRCIRIALYLERCAKNHRPASRWFAQARLGRQ